jgi:hypothetical protein
MTAIATGDLVGQHVTVPPEADPDTTWWWEALGRGELLLPHCSACDGYFFPPMPACPHCGSTVTDRRRSAGEGTIYSWVVVHLAQDPAFRDETPYTVVAVHLTEGARVFGRISNGPLADGMRVRAVPYAVGETTLLGFERI